MKKQPQNKQVFFLFMLFLGMGTAYAADFSEVSTSGQTLYYNIIDATNHYVELTYPGTNYASGWNGFDSPTGSIILPNSVSNNGVTYSVKAIGAFAFAGCSGITGSLTIPNSVTTIGNEAFRACSGLTGSLIIPNSVTFIGHDAFRNCSGFTGSLYIGNSVTEIDWAAFYGCSGFTGSLTIGNSVTTIGQESFSGCSGFTGSLTIPNSVTMMGEAAFAYCSGFNGSLTISNSLNMISEGAFYHCSGFTGDLTIPNSVHIVESMAFEGCSGFTGTLTIPSSMYKIYNGAFKNCSGFTHVNFNAYNCQPISFDDKPFEGCGGTLTIGNSVHRVPAWMFYDCPGFTGSLTIPDSVTEIWEDAFFCCTGFTGPLTMGNSVHLIKEYAFAACPGFSSLTISSSVSEIGTYAFAWCINLTSITVLAETPPTLDENVFEGVPTDIPVYVPCGSLADYQAAEGWSRFTNLQCITETLTVYDDAVTNDHVPAYIYYFDDFTKSQFVIPADDLVEMIGASITSLTFYAYNMNIPYTTVSSADVYLKEVNYTTISAYEPKASATTVYSGFFDILGPDSGGTLTINFSTPYVYQGGNLLVGIENTQDAGFKRIYFYGQTVSGASISGSSTSSTGTIPAEQQDFIPKTTFGFVPTCEAKSLPYTYGFEEEDEFGCWTMLNCVANTERSTFSHREGSYGFQFWYSTNPPQYLISPRFDGSTGMDVSFYYKNNGDEYPETFQVGYSTTTKSPSAFIWSPEMTAQNEAWTQYEDSFPEGTKYVAIKHTSNDQNVLYVDDFNFIPPLCSPEDQCELTFYLYDDYGDGWNGASINVVDVETGIVLTSLANENLNGITGYGTNELNTITLAVCDGRNLRFEWESGSWDDECSYTVTDINGNEIFSGSGAMSESVTYLVDCTQHYIFLTDGNWNNASHWNTGAVPDEGSDVIIRANAIVPAGYFAVADEVSLDGGSITVVDGGQLKHNTYGLEVTMEKHIKGYTEVNGTGNYYLLTFPFIGSTLPEALTATEGYDLYKFNNSNLNAEWRNDKLIDYTGANFWDFYLYASPVDTEISVTGNTFNCNANMEFSVSYTEGSGNIFNGWALLGNPYTYNVYVYRQNGDGELIPMPIMMYDAEGELQTIYSGPVAPMQGFFVHVRETTTVCFGDTALHEDDYIDLGLPSGTLWATCNVGASSPEEYGDYFSWGETTQRDYYDWSSYQYSNGSRTTLTKYCTDSSCGYNGYVDNLTTLLPEDDVAAVNWGGSWRMPTKEELQELYSNTTHIWTTQNGVYGRLFTASNGNSLFLPAAGYRTGSILRGVGSYANYWSNSLNTDLPYSAWEFDFDSNSHYMETYDRYNGQSVRPVRSGVPIGAIDGKFSVNADGDQVYFSQGNLQYQASTHSRRFAANQYDFIGADNSNISSSYSGWIDLFGWGTSGYDHGAVCYEPWSTSTTSSDYYAYGSYTYNLNDQTGKADWGYYKISNGGSQLSQWRTLTKDEWVYVFNMRSTASDIRYAKANVNDVNGVILLPDDWNADYYTLSNTNSSDANFSSNTITASQWSTLEQHGAVFLPAAGCRIGTSVGDVDSYGNYWSASCVSSSGAFSVDFYDSYLSPHVNSSRFCGTSVRLVRSAH